MSPHPLNPHRPTSRTFTSVAALSSAREFAFHGLLALLLGGVLLALPSSVSTRALMIVFGVYALVDALATLAWRQRDAGWLPVISGALGLLLGCGALLAPYVMALALTMLIGAWALLGGVVSLLQSFESAARGPHGLALGFLGVISTLFGVALLGYPWAGVEALAIVFALYFVTVGILQLVFAWQLKLHEDRTDEEGSSHESARLAT